MADITHGACSKWERSGAIEGGAGAIAEEKRRAGADFGSELILVIGGKVGAPAGRTGIRAAGKGIGDGEERGAKLVHGHRRLQLARMLV
jgi:hypothetical protein